MIAAVAKRNKRKLRASAAIFWSIFELSVSKQQYGSDWNFKTDDIDVLQVNVGESGGLISKTKGFLGQMVRSGETERHGCKVWKAPLQSREKKI